MAVRPIKLGFEGALGAQLSARLDLPVGPVRAYALFAHCFTCSKNLTAARKISEALTVQGIGVFRFDFTGLGGSGGDFASTNFTSNLEDLKRAADFMRAEFAAPQLLIGHSLGGAAVLAVAEQIPEARAVATIGAPADVDHVTNNFAKSLAEIRANGAAEVTLGGRSFVIRKQFLDDLVSHDVEKSVGRMKKALLVLHAPKDNTVGIENASQIFMAARHPKSFVTLDQADHLLSDAADANYAAGVIAAWADRYLDPVANNTDSAPDGSVVVSETGLGKFQAMVMAGHHRMLADEPESVGGFDSGPSPYDYLASALGACTSMTIRMYADQKQIALDGIRVEVRHDKIHASDCMECSADHVQSSGKIDRFERIITLHGDLAEETRTKLIAIANKCPVHRTLEAKSLIVTRDQRDEVA